MARRDGFSGYHPLVNILYFGLVLLFSMVLMHPVSLAISLGTSLTYALQLKGADALRRQFRYLIPIVALTALVNLAFHHEGVTILTYFPSGDPLTLESVAYGIAAGVMLAAVMTWFSCYTAVMTSDKFIYLFGGVLPGFSLVLSMALRFIPTLQARFHEVRQAQQGLGRDILTGGVIQRLKTAGIILSIVITWSLEQSIETADSMKSRGYGLPGRTTFSIYRFNERDKAALGWLTLCGGVLLMGGISGGFHWHYYPNIGGEWMGVCPLVVQLVYLALCLTPVSLNRKEDRKWNVSGLKM